MRGVDRYSTHSRANVVCNTDISRSLVFLLHFLYKFYICSLRCLTLTLIEKLILNKAGTYVMFFFYVNVYAKYTRLQIRPSLQYETNYATVFPFLVPDNVHVAYTVPK